MKVLIATILALTLVTPAFAEHRQDGYESWVKWAGCDATLVTDDDREIVSSHYNIVTRTLVIGAKDRSDLPREIAEMILFHEIGHCLQQQAGMFEAMTPIIVIELDADRWAADLACGMGRDGQRLLHDLMVWAKEVFDYDGDPWHGSLAQRIAQGKNAAFCRIAPHQAPLVTF